MAKNWKPGEAIEAIKENDKVAIRDIGGRFPLFLNLASQVNDAGAELLKALPDYTTVRKMESTLKGDVQDAVPEEDEEEEAEPVKEAPVKEKKAKAAKAKPVEAEEDEEEAPEVPAKTAKELFAECKKAGLEVEPKKPAEFYIAALKKHEAAQLAKVKAAKAKPAVKPAAKNEEDWDI